MVSLPTAHVRHRSEPRISANELAKFMVTADQGRLGIIRKAKDAPTAPNVRYRDLRSSIISHLTNIQRPMQVLYELRDRLERIRDDGAATEFNRQDAASSLVALEAFEVMANQLNGYRFQKAPSMPYLEIAGVNVSVNLDMVCMRDAPRGKRYGGVLIRMTKADEETDNATRKRRDMGTYAATLAMMQSRSLSGFEGPVHHDACMSVDVQYREVIKAPRSFLARGNQIEAACRFIAAMWDGV